MTASASKKYLIIQGPTLPGQIAANTITDVIGNTIHYNQVGKLIFNIYLISGSGAQRPIGGNIGGGENSTQNAPRIATLLGTTVNTIYVSQAFGSGPASGYELYHWNPGVPNWQIGGIFGNEVLEGILLN